MASITPMNTEWLEMKDEWPKLRKTTSVSSINSIKELKSYRSYRDVEIFSVRIRKDGFTIWYLSPIFKALHVWDGSRCHCVWHELSMFMKVDYPSGRCGFLMFLSSCQQVMNISALHCRGSHWSGTMVMAAMIWAQDCQGTCINFHRFPEREMPVAHHWFYSSVR